MRDDQARLQDILEAIEQIEKYVRRGRDDFENDELIQTWTLHHLRIIGEACRTLSDETKDKCPSIPWRSIGGMRNILIHHYHYFDVDIPIVWSVVEKELPVLKREVSQLLSNTDDPSTP